MSSVIDASAILAYLQGEPGQDLVEAALDAGGALVTSVNYCEVLGKLCDKGMPIDEAQDALDALGMTLVDFDVELAVLAAGMKQRTAAIGASLGDRACLALAAKLSASAPKSATTLLTAEQAWAKLHWPFKLVVIRAAGRKP